MLIGPSCKGLFHINPQLFLTDMSMLVFLSVLQEMKPEEKKAKDRQLWKDWIDQYR